MKLLSHRKALKARLAEAGQLGPVKPFEFFLPGRAATKGSSVPFTDMKTGQLRVKNDNERTKRWQEAIGLAARAAGARPGIGPVRVELAIALERPASHFGTGRNAGQLKPSAPTWPTTVPDVDKVTRAVLDGLTFVAWLDDSQVVELDVSKVYAASPAAVGVSVAVEPPEEEQAA